MCKSDWNFDYHGIIFLKEIPWTKSTSLWTDERAPVHGPSWTELHTASGDLIWVTHRGFDGLEQMGMRQRRLKVARRWSHRRVTGMALWCAKARREEPRRGRGGW
jgi:hypothetical protein